MTDARTERTRHMHMMGPHNGPGGPTRTRVQGRCAGIHLYTRLHAHRGTHTHTHTLHGSTRWTGSASIRGARIVESVTNARGRQAGPYPESVAGGSTDDGVMSSPQSITITVALLKARLCVFHCVCVVWVDTVLACFVGTSDAHIAALAAQLNQLDARALACTWQACGCIP